MTTNAEMKDSAQISLDVMDYIPTLKKINPHTYPTKFLTIVENSDLTEIKTHEDKSKSSTYQTLSLNSFEQIFGRNPSSCDLTEINFQNFALGVLKNENALSDLRHWSHSNPARKRILRAAIYAISSRDDVNWDGTFIDPNNTTLRQQKKQQLENMWNSLRLYSWTLATREDVSQVAINRFDQECHFDLWKMDTQSAVEKLYEQHPDAKICWLSMANGHDALGRKYGCISHSAGTFHSNYGVGSQEEDLASNSTIAATLGMRIQFEPTGWSGYFSGELTSAVYKMGFHIPPGGNYFSSCRMVTSSPQIDCHVIVASFADFRTSWITYNPWSERSEYYYSWGHVKNQIDLENRLKMDTEGVCRTAIKEGVDVLVLGASGCGVYRHNAWMEARMWKETLSKYTKSFKKVIFAVLADDSSPQNLAAFSYYFKSREPQNASRS